MEEISSGAFQRLENRDWIEERCEPLNGIHLCKVIDAHLDETIQGLRVYVRMTALPLLLRTPL